MTKPIYKTYLPYLFLLLAAMLIMGVNTQAQAQETTRGILPPARASTTEELKPHIGLQLGVAEPGSEHDAATQYGLEFGFQPYIPFAVALEANSFLTDRDDQDNLRRTSVIAKGTYNFGGARPIIRHSFVGAGLGAIIDTAGEDETNAGIKLLAGVDFPLNREGLVRNRSFTLGATASYLTVFNAQDTFALNGQLKYWF